MYLPLGPKVQYRVKGSLMELMEARRIILTQGESLG